MNYAQEQGELQTRELGLYCTDHSYKFLAFDARRNLWVPIEDDDALRTAPCPMPSGCSWMVEGREVVLARSPMSRKSPAAHRRTCSRMS